MEGDVIFRRSALWLWLNDFFCDRACNFLRADVEIIEIRIAVNYFLALYAFADLDGGLVVELGRALLD